MAKLPESKADEPVKRNEGSTLTPRTYGDHDTFGETVTGSPVPSAVASPENPAAPRPTATVTTPGGDPVLAGVKKGDLVRLLVPHYDGFKLLPADSVVPWWNDEPPTTRNACLPDADQTPLKAPAMTDGKPPDHYVDPETGKKPVITSV